MRTLLVVLLLSLPVSADWIASGVIELDGASKAGAQTPWDDILLPDEFVIGEIFADSELRNGIIGSYLPAGSHKTHTQYRFYAPIDGASVASWDATFTVSEPWLVDLTATAWPATSTATMSASIIDASTDSVLIETTPETTVAQRTQVLMPGTYRALGQISGVHGERSAVGVSWTPRNAVAVPEPGAWALMGVIAACGITRCLLRRFI